MLLLVERCLRHFILLREVPLPSLVIITPIFKTPLAMYIQRLLMDQWGGGRVPAERLRDDIRWQMNSIGLRAEPEN